MVDKTPVVCTGLLNLCRVVNAVRRFIYFFFFFTFDVNSDSVSHGSLSIPRISALSCNRFA